MVLPAPLTRLLAALPDAAMAAAFLAAWLSPSWLDGEAVRIGLLVMLVEFFLVHATAVLGVVALSPRVSVHHKRLCIIGFGAIYLAFIFLLALQFQSWWPVLALAWLLLSKSLLAAGRGSSFDRRHRMHSMWAVSVMAYLGGAMVTVLLPLPSLGLTRDLVADLGLPGSGGLWVDQPHTVLAFGTLYFLVLAITRGFDLRLPAGTLPAMRDDTEARRNQRSR